MSIRNQLLLSFLAVTLLTAVVGIVATLGMRSVAVEFGEVQEDNIPATRAMAQITEVLTKILSDAQAHTGEEEHDDQHADHGFKEEFGEQLAEYQAITDRAPLPLYQDMVDEMNERTEIMSVNGYQLIGLYSKLEQAIERGAGHEERLAIWNEMINTYIIAATAAIDGTVDETDEMDEHAGEIAGLIARQDMILIVVTSATLLFATLFGFIIARKMSKPIQALTEVTRDIAAGDLQSRASMTVHGEIGDLAVSFNAMTEELLAVQSDLIQAKQHAEHSREQAVAGQKELAQSNSELSQEIIERQRLEKEREELNRRLIVASRQAGMAEVATGVLHNVGNTLNSVNISVSQISKKVRASGSGRLVSVADLVEQHTEDLADFVTKDERGVLLPKVLRELSDLLASEQAEVLVEVGELDSHIDHIKTVVSTQQDYAKLSGMVESASPVDLVRKALLICGDNLTRHRVTVVQEHSPQVPAIVTDQHKVVQVLVNLINNAKEAMSGVAEEQRIITLRIEPPTGGFIRVSVLDRGIGIRSEDMTKIFSHGFTTKSNGHGFGLHSSALAAKELGGLIAMHSDGEGKGASFTLELPATQEEEIAA